MNFTALPRKFRGPMTIVLLALSSLGSSRGVAEEPPVRVQCRSIVDQWAVTHSGQTGGDMLDYIAFRHGKDTNNPLRLRLEAEQKQIASHVESGPIVY